MLNKFDYEMVFVDQYGNVRGDEEYYEFEGIQVYSSVLRVIINLARELQKPVTVSHQNLERYPSPLVQLEYKRKRVNSIVLSNQFSLHELPSTIRNFKEITSLWVDNSNLTRLQDWISEFTDLKLLSLSSNMLVKLPDSLCTLKDLQVLKLNNNKLKTLPENIGNLKSLRQLDVSRNELESVPDSVDMLHSLSSVSIHPNPLQSKSHQDVRQYDYIINKLEVNFLKFGLKLELKFPHPGFFYYNLHDDLEWIQVPRWTFPYLDGKDFCIDVVIRKDFFTDEEFNESSGLLEYKTYLVELDYCKRILYFINRYGKPTLTKEKLKVLLAFPVDLDGENEWRFIFLSELMKLPKRTDSDGQNYIILENNNLKPYTDETVNFEIEIKEDLPFVDDGMTDSIYSIIDRRGKVSFQELKEELKIEELELRYFINDLIRKSRIYECDNNIYEAF